MLLSRIIGANLVFRTPPLVIVADPPAALPPRAMTIFFVALNSWAVLACQEMPEAFHAFPGYIAMMLFVAALLIKHKMVVVTYGEKAVPK